MCPGNQQLEARLFVIINFSVELRLFFILYFFVSLTLKFMRIIFKYRIQTIKIDYFMNNVFIYLLNLVYSQAVKENKVTSLRYVQFFFYPISTLKFRMFKLNIIHTGTVPEKVLIH